MNRYNTPPPLPSSKLNNRNSSSRRVPPKTKVQKQKRILLTVIISGGILMLGGMITLICWAFNRDFSVSPSTVSIPADGGMVTLDVKGPGNWEVLESPAPWIIIDIGNGLLNIGAPENEGLQRSATIRIGNNRKSCTVNVVQESGAFFATPSNAYVNPHSGFRIFKIAGQADWQITEGPKSWGRVEKTNSSLFWYYDENTGEEREDAVVLQSGSKTLTLSLTQGAALSAEKMSLTASGSKHTSYIKIYGPSDWDVWSHSNFIDCSREGDKLRIDFEKNEDEPLEGEVVINGGGQKITISVKQNKYSSGGYYYPYFNPYPYSF